MIRRQKVRVLAANMRAMLILQVANYLLPLLLIPYLARVLGLETYGLVAFGLGICQLAAVATDFGFGLSATYYISKRRGRIDSVNRLAGAVSACKALLSFVVVALIASYALLVNQQEEQRAFLLLLLLAVIGQALQPIWFFQGIERLGFVALCTVLSKAVYVLLVLLTVSVAADYYRVALAFGIANIASAAVATAMLLRLGYRFVWPGWRFTRAVFANASGFFASRAAVAAYASAGTVFLGVVGGTTQVAIYSAAEQLYKAAQTTVGLTSQALYPYMVREKDYGLLLRLVKLVVAGSLVGMAIGYALDEYVITLVFGPEFLPSVAVLDVFLVAFVVAAPSVLLGYPLLGALGKLRLANLSVIVAGLVQVCLLATAAAMGWATALQVAFCVLLSELIVLSLRIRWAEAYGWRS